MLTFRIDPVERDRWLEVEAGAWTRFLERQDGFVAKQVWVDTDDEWTVHCVIHWRSMAEWKAITPEQCDAVNAEMGDMFRPATSCRALEVVRPSP